MAKDVDLTSREWREIVFEGKTRNSEHTKSVKPRPPATQKLLYRLHLVAVGIILVLLILSISGVFAKPEEDTVAVSTVRELVTMETEEEIEEEIEEETFQLPELEEIVAPKKLLTSSR